MPAASVVSVLVSVDLRGLTFLALMASAGHGDDVAAARSMTAPARRTAAIPAVSLACQDDDNRASGLPRGWRQASPAAVRTSDLSLIFNLGAVVGR
jgi:hypothetical protein